MSEDRAADKTTDTMGRPTGDLTRPWMRKFFECIVVRHEERVVRASILVPVRSEFLNEEERRK